MRMRWRDGQWLRLATVLGATSLLAPACRDRGDTPMDDDGAGATDDDADDDVADAGTDGDADADADNDADESSDDGPEIDIVPAPGGLRRLLGHQYIASVQYLLGGDAANAATPPEDPSLGGFDSLATTESTPSPADVENYEESAAAIAEAVIADPGYLAQTVPCVMGTQDEACYVSLATEFGRLAWRRPLTSEQIDMLVDVAVFAQEWDEGEFMSGVQYMLTAILQSPSFIYLVEVGEQVDGVDHRVLDPYETAARMSYFLLGRTTDASTMALAAADGLATDDDVRALAWQMVGAAEARTTVKAFYDEYLRIRELPTKGKDTTLFPLFTPDLADAMRDETLLLIEDIVFQNDGDVLQLIDADYTFVNEELATLYGVSAPAAGTWANRSLPAEQNRAGIFTHGSWLAMQSHNNVNSPTRRGLFIQEEVLCTAVPPVPPEVTAEPVLPEDGQTLREALLQHQNDPSCSGCHALIDPLGFAFENYDSIGEFRTLDNGGMIDSTGSVEGLGEFANAAELASILRADPRVSQCLVNQYYKHGLGYAAGVDQAEGLIAVEAEFAASEHNLKAMLVELVASPLFRLVDEPK